MLVSGSAAAAGCGGSTPAQGAQAAPPPTAVEVRTVEPKPIEQASEFIATLRSLRSTTVQPEVEGVVTRIFVKAGDRVRRGDPLVQINADRQVASVRSTEADRAGAEADVQYWRGQVARLESLIEAGAISTQEFEQAQNTLRTAEARLAALDAQLREARVELQFFRVTAPQSGTVGEITVREGDRITRSTEITTIDQQEALEVYIQVPLDRSPDLRVGLPVQLLDRDGAVVAANPITFIAPRVDEATQTVLVKSAIRGPAPSAIRLQQFVRARIVWSSEPGLTVPITAVTRISGQYFVFVAEPGPGGGLVARQKPVEVGEVLGNEYVVRRGLAEGDRLSELERLSEAFPPGLRYEVAFNATDVVEESIAEVLKTLIEAIAFVVLVIFVFLQTWRSTLIPAITIPVSLIGTFAFINLGYSINTLTLFGLILATGIVVDDAIVVIEKSSATSRSTGSRRGRRRPTRCARFSARSSRSGSC